MTIRIASAFVADLRSGVRALLTYPILSIVAIVTLGLGLGISITVFSIVNGALFKALPFRDPARVVGLVTNRPSEHSTQNPIAVQDLPTWQSRLTVFESFGAYGRGSIDLSTEAGRPERESVGRLTVAAFRALGVQPMLGRGFQPGDDAAGAPPVMLIDAQLWHDRFGQSPAAIKMMVRADGIDRAIVGVMPARFGFPENARAWVPLVVDPLATARGKGPFYDVIARLAPGATLAQANAQCAGIAAELAREFPQTNGGVEAEVLPYMRLVLDQDAYNLLFTMLGAGIGVLLIACVNVSNLLVARASLRRREVAVRIALGASRGAIVRQHLTEVLVLSALGGVIGLAIGVAGVRWFSDALSVDPPPLWMTFDVDTHVALFVAALILLSALAAGGVPALGASRVGAASALKDDSRSSTSSRLGRFSAVLVTVELAVSCGLLVAAGVMVRSVLQLERMRMPFAVDHVLTMRLDLPSRTYRDLAARVRFFDQLVPRLAAQPGVEAAAAADLLPGAGSRASTIEIEGQSYAKDADRPGARRGLVTPGFFDTFQVKPLRGRLFTAADDPKAMPIAVVNESFIRRHYPGADPIGRRLRTSDGKPGPWLTIVGVVPDLLMRGIGNESESDSGFYQPIAQADVGDIDLIVRTTGDAAAATSLVRAAVAGIDRDLPVYDVRTMADVIRRETWFYVVFGLLFTAFGAAALLLAAAGLYGVMSFAVTQRHRELGVRSALGANGRQLVWLVMRRSLIQLSIGLGLGLALGLLATGPLAVVLYRVNPRDPVVVIVVAVLLAATGILASLLPAWRVTRIDPAIVLVAE